LELASDLRKTEPQPEPPKAAPAAAPLLPGQARTLAFYQANAGQRVPAENGRTGPSTKYALPIAYQGATASKPLPIPAAEEKTSTSDAPAPQDATPSAWFSSAMMRGLDRYRAAQQLNKPPPQVDVSQ
jgi:hypothetical protein